jgi:SAM-dependent methyltransferase
MAAEVHGIDISEAMVSHTRAACPDAIVEVRDLRDLNAYETATFDAVLAPFNVLDALDHGDRLLALADLARIITPNGLLIMSAHNRAHASFVVGPARAIVGHARAGRWRSVAGGVIRLPRRTANRRRLRRFEHERPEYAILNDSAHDFSLLHYYITRDEQERQLQAHGFTLVECLDLEAKPVAAGAHAEGSPELHYVARRT